VWPQLPTRYGVTAIPIIGHLNGSVGRAVRDNGKEWKDRWKQIKGGGKMSVRKGGSGEAKMRNGKGEIFNQAIDRLK